MMYEIINPSDAYTLVCDDFKIACLATLLLGHGKYGLQSQDASQEMPVFFLGGEETWFPATFGATFDELLPQVRYDDLARCLESVVIGSFTDRTVYDIAMKALPTAEDRASFAEQWHEVKRSSLNDIGARAKALAKMMRLRIGEAIQ